MLNKYPLLINNRPNMKITFDDFKILSFCNGMTDIKTIMKETGMSKLKVLMILKKYQKRGKMRIKYTIGAK
ncbi:MAG: hypothetical protein GF329_12865 [Candidatus Lokiarchaeota archaeon]|nr:hypothetical protein [Candidatus Lokiarchaeota archaeon]